MEILQRGGTFFPLPAGDKAPPPIGVTGKFACVKLSAEKRAALIRGAKDDANVGLLLGHRRVQMPDGRFRGVFVLDEDNKPARITEDGKECKAQYGSDTLLKLEALLGELPTTLRSFTPGYGSHRVFWAPDEIIDLGAKILAKAFGEQCGLDVLTEGRYMLFPGSKLSPEIAKLKGYIPGEYVWQDASVPIAEFPIKWIDYLVKLAGGAASQHKALKTETETEPPHLSRIPQDRRVADAAVYVAPLRKYGAGDGSGQLMKVASVVTRGFGVGVTAGVAVIRASHLGEGWTDDQLRKRCEDAREVELGCMYANQWPEDLAHVVSSIPPNPAQPGRPEVLSPIKWGGWDQPIFPPVYLLEGLIPEGKVCTFFAEGGSVKTWSAFALAISVATGRPWLGHTVKQGRVVYMDYEDGRYEFQRRMRILNGGLEDIPSLGYWYGAPYLHKPDTWKILAPLDLTLLVIDALSSGVPGDSDENASAFSEAVKLAGRFTEIGCTVLIIHHANKQGGIRGHSSVRDQSDVVFKFEPVSETDDIKRMRMICDKPGPQKKPAPVNVELSDKGLQTFEDEAHETGRNAETPVAIADAILLALKDGPILTKEKIRDAVGKDRGKVFKEIDALTKAKRIVFIEEIGYVLDDPKARERRVFAQIKTYAGWTSAAKLAKAAYVTTRFVEDMLTRGVIYPRSESGELGGFIEKVPS